MSKKIEAGQRLNIGDKIVYTGDGWREFDLEKGVNIGLVDTIVAKPSGTFVQAVGETHGGGLVYSDGSYAVELYEGAEEVAEATPVSGPAILGVNDAAFVFSSMSELYNTLSVLYAKADRYQEFVITKGE